MIYRPKHLQIETVNKLCNAKCDMCTIFIDKRNAEIMSLEKFKQIIDRFIPFKEDLEFLTLHGCGEPLLDKTLPEKISYAKKLGFKGIGFSTNAGLLTPDISKKLLESGLDTLICSIDGFTKEVQETIRLKAGDFDEIYNNVQEYIKIRDSGAYKGRILMRMIVQKLNYKQWGDYYTYWSKLLSKEKGDDVLRFEIHNCGGKVERYDEMKLPSDYKEDIKSPEKNDKSCVSVCPDIFERLIIFADGSIGFCSTDQDGWFDFPNILDGEVLDIYNSKFFTEYRNAWLNGKENSLKYCSTCNVTTSRNNKTLPDVKNT